MKRTISLVLKALMLLLVCLCGTSCGSSESVGSEPPVDFNEKYYMYRASDGEILNDRCYVFHSDGTGVYEFDYFYDSPLEDASYDYTLSGKIEFVWRVTSDGAVHLFETETTYNENNTEGKTATLIREPIYFSEEFFTYTYYAQYGSSTVTYVKEGTELSDILNG